MRIEDLLETLELRAVVAARLVHVDELADLGEREAEALSAQRQLEPGAVAGRVDAPLALAARREQALGLVEPDRARRDVELLREFADRKFGALGFHARVRLILASCQRFNIPGRRRPSPALPSRWRRACTGSACRCRSRSTTSTCGWWRTTRAGPLSIRASATIKRASCGKSSSSVSRR